MMERLLPSVKEEVLRLLKRSQQSYASSHAMSRNLGILHEVCQDGDWEIAETGIAYQVEAAFCAVVITIKPEVGGYIVVVAAPEQMDAFMLSEKHSEVSLSMAMELD